MKTKIFRSLWIITLLASGLFACSVVSQVGDRFSQVQETAQSVATLVQGGQELLATGQALATQVDESGLKATGEAVATQLKESGFEETVQAAATQFKESGFEETAQAVITQNAPGLFETLQAVATRQGPEVEQTLQAVATQAALSLGKGPAGIPLVEGEKEHLSASDQHVSYTTVKPFAEVLNFYKTEMVNQGWTEVEQGTIETETMAVLNFEKPDHNAVVILNADPATQGTIVAVTLLPR